MARDSVPDPEALRKLESGSTFEVWQVRSSTMRLDRSHAGVVALTLVGHGHTEFAAPMLRCWTEAARKSERVTLFVDFWEMPGYESQLRVSMTEWALAHRAQLEPMHMLARSSLVRMGIAVANLTLGGLIRIHTQRPSYDIALKPFKARPR